MTIARRPPHQVPEGFWGPAQSQQATLKRSSAVWRGWWRSLWAAAVTHWDTDSILQPWKWPIFNLLQCFKQSKKGRPLLCTRLFPKVSYDETRPSQTLAQVGFSYGPFRSDGGQATCWKRGVSFLSPCAQTCSSFKAQGPKSSKRREARCTGARWLHRPGPPSLCCPASTQQDSWGCPSLLPRVDGQQPNSELRSGIPPPFPSVSPQTTKSCNSPHAQATRLQPRTVYWTPKLQRQWVLPEAPRMGKRQALPQEGSQHWQKEVITLQ